DFTEGFSFAIPLAANKTEDSPITVKSLAVLPFQSLSKEAADEHLGLGMAHDTIIKLSRLHNIVVLPTRAVFKCAEVDSNPLVVVPRLGVDAFLDGTIQRVDDRVRVTVRLLSLEDGMTLWAKNFDERFTVFFGVQDSISKKVVMVLSLRITADQRKQ